MSQTPSDRVDFRVSSRAGWLSLVSQRASEADPGLLTPDAARDWEEVAERGDGVVIPEGADTARFVMGELDWGDWEGLVDKASWKLDLSSGALVIGGARDPEGARLPLEPGSYWVTLYSFAREDADGELLVHLQKAEEDGDFLRTSFQYSAEEPASQEEPLAMGSEETAEVLAYDEAETEELLATGGDPFDEDEDDEPSEGILVRLRRDR